MRTKKRENKAHARDQNTSPDTVPEESQASNLLGKDFKIIVLNMFNEHSEISFYSKFWTAGEKRGLQNVMWNLVFVT